MRVPYDRRTAESFVPHRFNVDNGVPDCRSDSPNGRSGLVLVESKFTEHSFYECSGRMKLPRFRGHPIF
jgi:hypothetical protein